MTGIKDDLGIWETPPTWEVGETIDSATWIERVTNPLNLLLRRPLTVLTQSADTTVSAGTTGNVLDYDTVVKDDDGMIIDDGAASYSEFYAQRDGIFAVYATALFVGNTTSGKTCKISILVNSTIVYARESPLVGTSSGQDEWHSVNGDVSMTEGDYVQIQLDNQSSSDITVKAEFNSPRLVVKWKRPFLS